MSDQVDPGNTEFVLPIICPNCKHEINLAMLFSLLAPKKEEPKKDHDIAQEDSAE